MPEHCAWVQDPRAKLSTDLVALLADNYLPAQQLLKRVFPPGLLMYLAQRRPAAAPREFAARDSKKQVGPIPCLHLLRHSFSQCSTHECFKGRRNALLIQLEWWSVRVSQIVCI